MRLRRLVPLVLAALTCALAAAPAQAESPHAVLALLPVVQNPPPNSHPPVVRDLIDSHPELALGLVSATQSGYSPEQALLDLTAGTRTSRSTYHPTALPDFTLLRAERGPSGQIVNWLAAVVRADSAPADIVPGLLASSIPGGIGYAGISGQPNTEALAAADRDGTVAAISLGRASTVSARARTLLRDHRLVVALLPPGYDGDAQLQTLIERRAPGDLLIAMEDPPPSFGPQLLWTGIAGLGPAQGLTSDTTRTAGIAAGIDLAPTILRHLGIAVPSEMRGEPIRVGGARDAAALQRLNDRLGVIVPRRIPVLETLLFTWLGVVLLAGILRDRRGVRFGMRIGGLAFVWLPSVLLFAGALQPSRQAELFLVAGGCFALALATDRLVRWPRGPALPALVALLAYAADLANRSHFVIRSLLGPSPRSGSRFYGLGNELEIALTILLLIAVAATLRSRRRRRGGAAAFALGGVALAVVMGSGRLGADVGGIFTVAGGAAVATLLMLPGGVSRRAVAIALATPVVGLAALALLDLATGGNGHFTRNVLHGSAGDLLNTFERRYELAWSIVHSGYAPLLTLLCLLAVGYALRHRHRVYATVDGDAVWRACLGGGVGASVAGSLFNDSGPVLLFIGIVALACLTAYLRGAPDAAPPPEAPPSTGLAAAEPASATLPAQPAPAAAARP